MIDWKNIFIEEEKRMISVYNETDEDFRTAETCLCNSFDAAIEINQEKEFLLWLKDYRIEAFEYALILIPKKYDRYINLIDQINILK